MLGLLLMQCNARQVNVLACLAQDVTDSAIDGRAAMAVYSVGLSRHQSSHG